MKRNKYKILVGLFISFITQIVMFAKLNQDYVNYILISTPSYLQFEVNRGLMTLSEKYIMFRYEYIIGFAIMFFIILFIGENLYDEYRSFKK